MWPSLGYQEHSSTQPEAEMTTPVQDDREEKPLDPAMERVRRRLVRFIAINLGILFLALMAVAVALVYRMNASAPPAQQASGSLVPGDEGIVEGRIVLPEGARLNSHAVSGDRLTLDVMLAGGVRAIFVYDMAQQRMIGRFDIGAGQP
jgi:hypothetical protein